MLANDQAVDPLADLRPNYVARLRTRIKGLSLFLADCKQGEPSDEDFETNHRCVHSMISSAAIFGHSDLSQSARAAERAFENAAGAKPMLVIEPIEQLLRRAEQVLDAYDGSLI